VRDVTERCRLVGGGIDRRLQLAFRRCTMEHPNDTSWFLRDPSDGGSIQDQRPPRVDPDSPDQTPHLNDRERGAERSDSFDRQLQHQQPLPPRNSHPPPSGFRIPLASNAEFPSPQQVGPRACVDVNGVSLVYLGSAILGDSIVPCKIAPSVHPACRVPHEGVELHHYGTYDLLPITSDMEWVPTMKGEIPPGRRPVEGGYESNGAKLYHALGTLYTFGVYVGVPGKAGEHLGEGAKVPFGELEYTVPEYEILCWR